MIKHMPNAKKEFKYLIVESTSNTKMSARFVRITSYWKKMFALLWE